MVYKSDREVVILHFLVSSWNLTVHTGMCIYVCTHKYSLALYCLKRHIVKNLRWHMTHSLKLEDKHETCF